MSTEEVRVTGWAAPRGYANGRLAHGGALYVAGQIGMDADGGFGDDLVAQFAIALDNVLAVVREAGGTASDIATMTVFVTDIAAYRAAGKALGPVWRYRLGRHFPAMTLVAVTALVEPRAVVEIQATAHIEGRR